MADAGKNKIAARILRAEMIGDNETATKLRADLEKLESTGKQSSQPVDVYDVPPDKISSSSRSSNTNKLVMKHPDGRVKKFIKSSGSLNQMFAPQKGINSSTEAKTFMKLANKFSRDDQETKYFSEEIDDSQKILSKSKRFKFEDDDGELGSRSRDEDPSTTSKEKDYLCMRCLDRQQKASIIDKTSDAVYMMLLPNRTSKSNILGDVVIRSKDHSCNSFISSSHKHQAETEKIILSLTKAWKTKGYHNIIMETHLRNRRPLQNNLISCDEHFQIHCYPIKEKLYEQARMYFKQALQSSEKEWSLNKKSIKTEGRRIQRYLPVGLSYFWVCFDSLDNGFGFVIEDERQFSERFGLEVICGLTNEESNPRRRSNPGETYQEMFERAREFKIMYSSSKEPDQLPD